MGVRASYLAVVTSVADPEQRARIRVKCPDLSGNHEIPEWLSPRAPYGGKKGAGAGMFFVPAPGDTVELELDHDEEGLFVTEASGLPRAAYRAVLLPAERVPAVFRPTVNGERSYPNVAGFSFPDGSYLTFNYHPKARVVTAAMGAATLVLDELNKVARLEDDAEVRLRATDGQGQIVLEAANVLLGGDLAAESVLLGDTYRAAEDTLFDLLNTLSTTLETLGAALAAEPFLGPSKAAGVAVGAAATALVSGIAAFTTAAASYKSTKVRTE